MKWIKVSELITTRVSLFYDAREDIIFIGYLKDFGPFITSKGKYEPCIDVQMVPLDNPEWGFLSTDKYSNEARLDDLYWCDLENLTKDISKPKAVDEALVEEDCE